MAEFVDDDFVEPGFVEGDEIDVPSSLPTSPPATLSLLYSPGYHATDFREYSRGRFPSDWFEHWQLGAPVRVEGSHCDMPHRSVLRLEGLGALKSAFIWSASLNDPNSHNQETLVLYRCTGVAGFQHVSLLRVSGAAATENAYRVTIKLTSSPEIELDKIVAGASTSLGTAANSSIKLGSWIWIRARTNLSESLTRCKVWMDGDAEPVLWTISSGDTTAALAAGYPGLGWTSNTEIGEVKFFSLATNGQTAPGPDQLSPPLETWISDKGEELETIVRVEYYNPDTDTVESTWISQDGHSGTPYSDFPPLTRLLPLLLDAGDVGRHLESDHQLASSAIPNLAPIRFNNKPYYPGEAGPLDLFRLYSFFSRPVEIRMGRRWAIKPTRFSQGVRSKFRSYEIVASGVPTQEPEVTLDDVTIPIGPSTSLLSLQLPAYRNVGISTGVKALSNAGYLNIPSSSSYNITSYRVSFRVFIPSAGVAGSGLSLLSYRGTSEFTVLQWRLGLYQASNALAHKIEFLVMNGAGVVGLQYVAPIARNINRFVDVIVGFRSQAGAGDWYLLIDNETVGSGVIAFTPAQPTTSPVVVNRLSTGLVICDHRIEKWTTADHARTSFSARKDPDTLTISMHRCDDNSGSTVTDYAPLANHGTLQGTDAVDRSWSATYLGSSDLSGVCMPVSGGVNFHLPTQSIDPVRQAFRYNDRAKTTGAMIETRAKGLLLTDGVNFTQPSDRPGVVDIIGASDQPVTVGLAVVSPVLPENPRIHVPQLIKDELINRSALTPQACDTDSFLGLRQLMPFKGGFHYQEPPVVSEFLSHTIGALASYHSLDRCGRLLVGSMLPPLAPGPYGVNNIDRCLEFLGLPDCGVSLSYHLSYTLTQTSTFGVFVVFKVHRLPIDLSTSSTFTYFPSGMTLVDMTPSDLTAKGFYLGFDGRDGKIIFGSPGQTNLADGLHFTKSSYNIRPDTWYACSVKVVNNPFPARQIDIVPLDASDYGSEGSTEFTLVNGTMTTAVGSAVKIGHGSYGSFYGGVQYVTGYSGTASAEWESDVFYGGIAPTVTVTDPTSRFFLDLRDGGENGIGDYALEQVQGRYARLKGVRWCPRMTFDFRTKVEASMPSVRRPLSAWRIESKYKQNRQVLSGADIVASVSDADRLALGQPYLSSPLQSEDKRVNYKDSKDLSSQTPVLARADADFISYLMNLRLETDRSLSRANDWYREVMRLGLTDEVLMYHDRWGSSGKFMRVATLQQKMSKLRGDVGVWG